MVVINFVINYVIGQVFRLAMATVHRIGFAIAARGSVLVLNAIPSRPILALTPARTAIGRSLTVAPLLVGSWGLAIMASRSIGDWLLLPAVVIIGGVGIGCSRAFITAWWPVSLGATFLLLGLSFASVSRPSPWAPTITPQSAQEAAIIFGSAMIFALSVWFSTIALIARE